MKHVKQVSSLFSTLADEGQSEFIDIKDAKGNQNFLCKIVESNKEVPMCDMIVYHRKVTVKESTGMFKLLLCISIYVLHYLSIGNKVQSMYGEIPLQA